MRLLIHHHAVAYRDTTGDLWLPSFIGRWVDAIAPHVERIGLLMFESSSQTRQDQKVTASNVDLHSFGEPSGRSYLGKRSYVHQICRSVKGDGLLIRGVTPRQMPVGRLVNTLNKAFLLVGNLFDKNDSLHLDLTFSGLYSHLMTFYRPWEVRQLSRYGFTMLANSPTLVEQIQEQLGVSAYFVPTNSIQQKEFIPLEIRQLHTPLKLLYVGRLVKEKGILELIHALHDLKDATLDIVGSGAEPDINYFKYMAKSLKIEDRILWHGAVPFGDQLFSFYRQADMLILPTYHEGFPHVIWEAAASCCPIITTRVGGIPSLWQDGVVGPLIAPKDSVALVQSILALAENEALRHMYIRNAYYHAQAYSVEACAERLVATLSAQWRL